MKLEVKPLSDYDDSCFTCMIDGEKHYFHEQILGWLLLSNEAFINSSVIDKQFWDDDDTPQETTIIFINCNDVFAWACAEGEPATDDDIEKLYEELKKDQGWGSVIWVCKKRNQKPQIPVEEDMKKSGSWTEEMESLRPNDYWKK